MPASQKHNRIRFREPPGWCAGQSDQSADISNNAMVHRIRLLGINGINGSMATILSIGDYGRATHA